MFELAFKAIKPCGVRQGLATLAALTLMLGQVAAQEKVLRVAMTASDIPLTTGQPSQGGEGSRFMGVTLYDGLLNWDLSSYEKPAALVPGLAESWSVGDKDKTRLDFQLAPRREISRRLGIQRRCCRMESWRSFFAARRRSSIRPKRSRARSTAVRSIAGARSTITQSRSRPRSPTPVLVYGLVNIYFSSPKRWEEFGRDWSKFASKPSGTGPWILESFVPRERAELVRNPNYWDPKRVPKSDHLILLPIPDANTRVAALLSGQVDWVEAPPPDAISQLKAKGMQIVTNAYPHIWPYQISFLEDSPFVTCAFEKPPISRSTAKAW